MSWNKESETCYRRSDGVFIWRPNKYARSNPNYFQLYDKNGRVYRLGGRISGMHGPTSAMKLAEVVWPIEREA